MEKQKYQFHNSHPKTNPKLKLRDDYTFAYYSLSWKWIIKQSWYICLPVGPLPKYHAATQRNTFFFKRHQIDKIQRQIPGVGEIYLFILLIRIYKIFYGRHSWIWDKMCRDWIINFNFHITNGFIAVTQRANFVEEVSVDVTISWCVYATDRFSFTFIALI